MRITGQLTTPASRAQLRTVLASPEALSALTTLRDVTRTDPTTLSMTFTPSLGLGPIPFATTVVTKTDNDDHVELAVHGRYCAHVVDVALSVDLGPADDGTLVGWSADVAVRGAAASVGQRVVRDLATKAIDDVLRSAVEAAARVVGHDDEDLGQATP